MPDRLALIIANDEFNDLQLTRLATPSHDAEALAAVLHDPTIGGFDVTLLANETMWTVRRAIARLYQWRKKDDLLLLYYTGHGIKDDRGELYLAVRNVEVDLVSATAIDAAFVRGQLDRSHSQRKVVILDCCHSGAFAPGSKALGSAGAQETLAGNGYGRVILTASNAVEYAWEGDQLRGEPAAAALSLFTHFLVQGLRTGAADLDGDGQISLDELYDYVYEQVLTSGQARQTPQKTAHKVEGRIIIARNPHLISQPVGLPPELLQAIKSPLAWVRVGAVSELELLLRGRDEGLALAARAALEGLADDDSRRVATSAAQALSGASAAEAFMPTPVVREPVRRPRFPKLASPAPDVVTITAPIRLELVRIPAGEFLMGSDPQDKEAYSDEKPQHRVPVPEFYMGRYPVTNEQYAAFVKATDQRVPDHWPDGKMPLGKENHPVVNVPWHDVRAFCEWLSWETGHDFRLPTEAEWEKAASWDEDAGQKRRYPWGDEFGGVRCNTDESGIGDTTPVGQYGPAGESPYGCADMAGNVWEWTSSLHKAYPYLAGDGREDPTGEGSRVLRGGSFYDAARNARAAVRNHYLPDFCYGSRGCRVCAAAPLSPDSGR